MSKPTGKIFVYSTIGLQFAVTILLLLYAGYWIDERFGLTPLITISGAFLGFAIGLYNLIINIKDIESKNTDDKPGEKRKENKWH